MKWISILAIPLLLSSCFKDEVYYDSLGNAVNVKKPYEEIQFYSFKVDSSTQYTVLDADISSAGYTVVTGAYNNGQSFITSLDFLGHPLVNKVQSNGSKGFRLAVIDDLGTITTKIGADLINFNSNGVANWSKKESTINNESNLNNNFYFNIVRLVIGDNAECHLFCEINDFGYRALGNITYFPNGQFKCSQKIKIPTGDIGDANVLDGNPAILGKISGDVRRLGVFSTDCEILYDEDDGNLGILSRSPYFAKYTYNDDTKTYICTRISNQGVPISSPAIINLEKSHPHIALTEEGGYILATGQYSGDLMERGIHLIRFGTDGNQLWEGFIWLGSYHDIKALKQINDGSYLIITVSNTTNMLNLIRYYRE